MKSHVEAIEGAPVSEDDSVARMALEALRAADVEVMRVLTLFERDGARIDGVVVHGAVAIAAWEALRAARERSGRHPVIIGDAQAVTVLRDSVADERTEPVASILERASTIDPEAVLGERRAERISSMGGDLPHEEWDEEDERMTEEQAAEMSFTAGRDVLSNEPLPEVVIALLPTQQSWESAAWLAFGGWNECPPPEQHVALMHRWFERWGAEIVSMRHDVCEACIAEAPHDVGAARTLAAEHYAFAPDIVDQGTGSIERLAASLAGGRVWFFWWD